MLCMNEKLDTIIRLLAFADILLTVLIYVVCRFGFKLTDKG